MATLTRKPKQGYKFDDKGGGGGPQLREKREIFVFWLQLTNLKDTSPPPGPHTHTQNTGYFICIDICLWPRPSRHLWTTPMFLK